ncbi:hypothetical protein T4E_6277 [Trichinella pseudospiralis]|uniref:Uncharacterized protein n=1 Tax=Trichinella pseudospiralis TaxID=6337 RepID=A0A0V0XHZ2_TRIPS|nr:hypothetical protein T4E_6277 [Trichinella pseudospiralis]
MLYIVVSLFFRPYAVFYSRSLVLIALLNCCIFIVESHYSNTTADSFEVCLLFAVVVCVLESTETKCTKKR